MLLWGGLATGCDLVGRRHCFLCFSRAHLVEKTVAVILYLLCRLVELSHALLEAVRWKKMKTTRRLEPLTLDEAPVRCKHKDYGEHTADPQAAQEIAAAQIEQWLAAGMRSYSLHAGFWRPWLGPVPR